MNEIMPPLHGLRVLDFGHYLSGPLTGVLLADQGAEVIQVVRPDEPVWNRPAQETLSRGKRQVVLDLHTDDGIAEARALAGEADVLIENFRPDVMPRLGLGYDTLKAVNPGLVYVSLPGYSRHDARAHLGAWDTTVSAATGLFTDSSLGGAALDLEPTYTELPLPSAYAGMWGAIGAAAAVYGRQRHGHGTHVEVPLVDAAMSSAAGVIFALKKHPARYNAPPIPREIIDAISLNRAPGPVAAQTHKVVRNAMPPFFRNYRCSDGELLLICAMDHTGQIDRLLDVTGLAHELESTGLHRGDVFDLNATKNNVYAYRGATLAWSRLRKRLDAVFATDTADAWADRLATAGVPAVRQTLTSEFVRHPAMVESGIVVHTDDRVEPGPYIDLAGVGIATTRTPRRVSERRSNTKGWATARNFTPPTITDPQPESWSPLSDVNVLDLTNVIAGPAAGRTLADLGAKVIHVSDSNPAMGPRQTVVYGIEVHQGKIDLGLDLRSKTGADVLARALPSQDVVLYNKVTAQAERLGVTPEQVHAVNDRAIVTQITAFSGPDGGGWGDRPGFDPVLQAFSGIMRRYGGPDGPHLHGIASCVDYLTGFSGAYSTIIGLLARENGATRLFTRTSLARTAAWIQLPLLNKPDHDVTREGLRAKGPHALNRMYRTSDGWVQLTAARHRWPTVREALAYDAPECLDDAGRWLARRVRRMTATGAAAWARKAGVAAEPVRNARSLRRTASEAPPIGTPMASAFPSAGTWLFTHPDNEQYVLPMPRWLRAHDRRAPLAPAPRPGQHTREVLLALGYTDDEVESALSTADVTEGWYQSARYVPE